MHKQAKPYNIFESCSAANVFKGLQRNPIYIIILVTTSVLQVLIVQFGGKALHVAAGGLEGKYWAFSIGIGCGALFVQQLINFISRAFVSS